MIKTYFKAPGVMVSCTFAKNNRSEVEKIKVEVKKTNNVGMIGNIEELKAERPDLVKSFEGMTEEKLLKQCYLGAIDTINMETRVALFMAECTDNMSNTDYTVDSLTTLINQKKERDSESEIFKNTQYPRRDVDLKGEESHLSEDVITFDKDGMLNIGFWDYNNKVWSWHTDTMVDMYEGGVLIEFSWMYKPENLVI